MMKIGVADTMFAVIDMFAFAKQAIDESGEDVQIERYTVPGFKDLPVASKILIEKYGCDAVVALGMAGRAKIDEQCSHEASLGLINAQLMVNKHILGVFVHMNEAKDDNDLYELTRNRVHDHTLNAIALVKGKEALSPNAGKGIRQGRTNEGEIRVKMRGSQ